MLLGRVNGAGGKMDKTLAMHVKTQQFNDKPNPSTTQTFLLGFVCCMVCFQLPMLCFSQNSNLRRLATSGFESQLKGFEQQKAFLAPQSMPKIASENVSTDMRELQMDIFGLPTDFLNSTLQVNTLIETAIGKMQGVKVLEKMTYHFDPQGLTSLWLLSASHASIHTWPDESYAAVDILTCGSSDLVNISAEFEELFQSVHENATFRFAITERGQKTPRHVNDLAVQMMQMQLHKELPFRLNSKCQSIEVLDVQGTDYADGEHAHVARRLYLDGVLQLSSDDEYVYHESFIHPVMLAHKNPETVCIMGGGDGGALTNVLHHRSVQSAFLVEIDDEVVEVSKEAFPSFKPAFYDSRAHVVIADAFHWIGDYSRVNASTLDALFFDLLDLNVPSPLLDVLFTSDRVGSFVGDIKLALRGDGVAVFQLGERGALDECVTLRGINSDCEGVRRQNDFIQHLRDVFNHVRLYSQFVPSFLGPWLFAVASDDGALFERWGRSAEDIDADIRDRLYEHQALGFFKGATMQEFRFEPDLEIHVIEPFNATVPQQPEPSKCLHLQRAQPNNKYPGYQIPYMVADSQQGIGLGIYTLRPIRQGEVIWKFYNESFIEVSPENWRDVVEAQPYTKQNGLDSFLEKDWINEWPVEGTSHIKMLLELDDARFTNHGYTSVKNSKYMMVADETDASAAPAEYEYGKAIIAMRDIDACEEILESYTSGSEFFEDKDDFETPKWWTDVLASRGLTNELGFPPSRSPLPRWAWFGKPANSD